MAGSTARTTTRATKAAPSTSRQPTGAAKLEVVERRRRFTPTFFLVAILASAVAFGALSVQISLIHRQQRLDRIRSQITEIQMENKELRRRESRLQAPAEILRIARDELGMVEAKPPALVTPEVQTVGAPAPTTPDGSTTPPEGADTGAPADG